MLEGGLSMKNCEVVLKNATGLHARPASEFVQKASKFKSEVNIIKGERKFNAKSIMSILSMGAGQGAKLVLEAEGEDEQEAVIALKELIDGGFGE